MPEAVPPPASFSGTPPPKPEHPGWWRRNRRRLAWGALACAALAGIGLLAAGGIGDEHEQLVLYTVTRSDLNIAVTERGTLESQENIQVLCEVDDVDGDGIRGTPIRWIIPNGSSVEEGDLIVELTAASHQEQVDRQILDTEKARAEQIKAKAAYENQVTQNQTAEDNAELLVQLAELELEMFEDPENGTHQLEVEEIERTIDDINNQILSARTAMELSENNKHGAQELFRMGYVGKADLDQARQQYLEAESKYAASMNKLRTQVATLKKKKVYERKMQLLRLEGALDTAQRDLLQVVRDNQAALDQARAASEAADEALKKEEERLARYRQDLENCQIFAPSDGLVTYAVSDDRRYWLEEIREGATVRERQHILSLPNLKRMQVQTAVHESMLEQVHPGLRATIHVEAFSEKVYRGRVKTIAVLAGQQSTSTKVYDTVVTIDGEVESLKPGMTAVVDIHVDRLEDVLSVPVQAIVQIGGQSWCYVKPERDAPVRRTVKLGRTNDKFVQIRQGIQEGEQVVLNPMAIVDEQQSQQQLAPDAGARDAWKEPSPSDVPKGS